MNYEKAYQFVLSRMSGDPVESKLLLDRLINQAHVSRHSNLANLFEPKTHRGRKRIELSQIFIMQAKIEEKERELRQKKYSGKLRGMALKRVIESDYGSRGLNYNETKLHQTCKTWQNILSKTRTEAKKINDFFRKHGISPNL